MRRPVLGCLIFIAACSTGEGGLEADIDFEGFQPGCIEVRATDAMDSSNSQSTTIPVTAKRTYTVGIARGKGWSHTLSVVVSAHEASCSGPIVATVDDLNIAVPLGAPIQRMYTLMATDADGDGYVAKDAGTDCDDHNPARNPGEPEKCDDGIDNDCNGLIDCADGACGGKACSDGDGCTTGETCQPGGTCAGGTPRVCGAPTQLCRQADAGVCAQGNCSWPLLAPGTMCGTGMACNSSGVCVQNTGELNCADGVDNDGNGKTDCADDNCNNVGCDGGPCVMGAVCSGHVCGGGTRNACNSPPNCHDAGVCNDANGMCTYPLAAMGSSCSDGDGCTTGDACDNLGNCGGHAMTCPGNACNAGSCDAGACVKTPTAGSCDDMMSCTSGDQCVGGTCMGTPYTCAAAPACQAGGTCQGDGGCGFMPLANGAPCGDGGTCSAGMCNSIFTYAPSNVALSQLPPSDAGVVVDCSMTFDSSDGGGNWCNAAPAVYFITQTGSTEPAVVLSMPSLSFPASGTIRMKGTRPVIMLIWDTGTTTISGTINASSTGVTTLGPGGDRDSCAAQNGGSGAPGSNAWGSGAGGAGNGTPGGSGGRAVTDPTAGGVGGVTGPTLLTPLVGGCAGGTGGAKSPTVGGAGGFGGGALQISCAGDLHLAGSTKLSVSGGGGLGGSDSTAVGGGGAGSGGGILIEAKTLSLPSGAWVTSNGGGGGEGSDLFTYGNAGSDGTLASSSPAPGGPNHAMYGGEGGAGGALTALPVNGVNGDVGGGAGGAVGVIVLRAQGACTSSTNFSPLPLDGGNCP